MSIGNDGKSRQSPRALAFQQVLDLLDNRIKSEASAGLLKEIKADVVKLMNSSAPVASKSLKYYVGVGADGKRSMFRTNVVPTKETHSEFASVYAFNTGPGALWVVEKGVRETDRKVF